MTALSVTDVSQNFEGVQALANVSFEVAPGERRLIIGPNGAGKTTLFNVLAGSYAASSGQVVLFGRDITRLPAYARARLGLSRTFQITNLFYRLTVLENILLALQAGNGAASPVLRLLQQDRALLARADALLEQWGLGECAKQAAQDISYGQQRQLDILLAMAVAPKVLLLDEPTAGLSAAEVPRVKAVLRGLPRDTTVLMIEHDMDVAFEIADRITVLHQGRLLAEGNGEAIRSNPQVTEIYLGPIEAVAMLSVQNIHTYYGDSYILQGVSLELNPGQVVALLGRNGVGKTTLARSIMGLTPATRGRILFKQIDITRLPAHRIARLGIGLVPQGRQIFRSLSVKEHLDVTARGQGRWSLDAIMELFPNLRARSRSLAGKLSGGEKQMLAAARALVSNPALLVMDEPTEGLAPLMIRELGRTIEALKQTGTSIL